jgi:prophage tail gpP-like protein
MNEGPTAYVTFFGTAKVAALTFSSEPDGSLVATVVAFQVPPSGPAPG